MRTSASPPAVDSGRGWIVVGAAFLSTFTVFGIAYSFGAFFDSMAEDLGSGKGATALMFSITTCWYFVLGIVAGRAADRFGPRPVLVVGAVALGVGLLTTSRVESIWVGYVTYGALVGTAVACAYVPMVATVGGWFVTRRTAALGVAVAGIGTGTLVVVPLSERLIAAYGWRTAYVVLGVGGTLLLFVASLAASRPPIDTTQEAVPLGRIVRQRGFVVMYAATVLGSLALFLPFVFIADYAEDRGASPAGAAALVGIIGAASVVGRLGLGALGARFGPARLTQFSFITLTASFVLWLVAGSSYPLLVAFATVMGIGYGGFIALAPAVMATLFGTVGLGAILGALYTAAGIGGLFGPPIAGALIDRTSYATTIVAAMVVFAAASAVLFLLPPAPARTPAASAGAAGVR
ncbi:MAG: MFS transporter [Actinomycetota bacterium]|nr:MFS transporter [Actinomycetota bacterium]